MNGALSHMRTRGYLPHLERRGGTYFVTFRLTDSLPKSVLERWEFERRDIEGRARMQKRQLTDYEKKQLDTLYSQRVESYLDTSVGECWLKNPRVARLVVGALKYFDKKRYDLNAWCVMPNHVHAVFKPYFRR